MSPDLRVLVELMLKSRLLQPVALLQAVITHKVYAKMNSEIMIRIGYSNSYEAGYATN